MHTPAHTHKKRKERGNGWQKKMCLSSDLDSGGLLSPRSPWGSSLLLGEGLGGPMMMATEVSSSEDSQTDS